MDLPSQQKCPGHPKGLSSHVGPACLRLLIVLGLILGITFVLFRLIQVNTLTAGFSYLIAILVFATVWGAAESIAASLVAGAALNYFFMHPIGTFTIADPQNWVALVAFLVTSIVASQLSSHARTRAQEAEGHRLELERLYSLSRAILLTEPTQATAKHFAHQIARTFDCRGVALYDRISGETFYAGPEDIPDVDGQLQESCLQGTQFLDHSTLTMVTAIRLGGQPNGSLAIRGVTLSDSALQALTNLVAIGLERERGRESAARAEAARQSEELKSTLLDAIAHEFKTPLTSIKAAASALLSTPGERLPEERELLTVVDEEAERLARLVTEAIHMARIEAGQIQLKKGLHPVEDLISKALQERKSLTEGRSVNVQISNGLPMIKVDPTLIELAIRQLLDNALKYTPAACPINITARRVANNFYISVRDEGPGIPEKDQGMVFEKFYRGRNTRSGVTGTGLGLAIAREILRAHGGDISLQSSVGQGSEFTMSLPVPEEEKTT
jgi:two-component system, OmpR family, sensor histidine kinase KdpD